MGNITTHSTGRAISKPFIENLRGFGVPCAPVNSGVRLLRFAKKKKSDSEVMKMEKRKSILIAILVIQLALLFAVNRFFVSDMREDIDQMRQELTAKGMSSEQVDTIAYTLTKTKTNVSGYVLMTAVLLVALNGSVARFASKKDDH
jgi:hypothetical protein